ncbi:MAG: major tail protein [Ezakiella coagulans]|uniref:major tail protein n=1 Tax=Ezakiella coagulans TaxID=46507 RepID=UPI00399999FE
MEKVFDTEVRINVKNLYMAKATKQEDGQVVFDKPEHIIGMEKISRKTQMASGKKYGDGKIRKNSIKKSGYELSLSLNNLPSEWRNYLEGTTFTDGGVEYATSKDMPNYFATGWEVEKTGGFSEFVWFPFCQAQPIEQETQQTEDNINYSTDSITIMALENDFIGRYYTFIDTEIEKNKGITAKDFFSQVQVGDTITKAAQ